MRSTYLIAFVAGCGFSTSVTPGTGTDGNPPDRDGAVVDTPDGYVPDARACFGSGLGMTCLPAVPTQPRQLSTTNSFDTGTDSNCEHVMTVGGAEACVLTGTTVTLASGTFRAVGPRPLVIVATEAMMIDGTISVSSLRGMASGAGASSAACPTPNQGEDDSGGGGGGAGGSFLSTGGTGGTGDTNDNNNGAGGQPAAAMQAPTTLRGGCAGGRGGNATQNGGAGGAGGGAVYLIAGTSIAITGGVHAGGAGGSRGGVRGGGGGGGSGGFVGLDAPAIEIGGAVTANGGGAGEGGGFNAGGHGSDATTDDSRAPGGQLEPDGGNGGAGGALAGASGLTGGNSEGGGGGGGGGVGYIYVKGTLAGAGTISPDASVF